MAAVMLSPRELAIEQTDIDGRHLRHAIVLLFAEILYAEQSEDRTRRNRGHVAALMIEPVCVALLEDAVADEHPARRDECDELMRIDGDVIRRLGTEGRFQLSRI